MSNRFSGSFVHDMHSACQNIANRFEEFLASIEGDLDLLSWADNSTSVNKDAFREAMREVISNDFTITNEELEARYGEDFGDIMMAAAAHAIRRAA